MTVTQGYNESNKLAMLNMYASSIVKDRDKQQEWHSTCRNREHFLISWRSFLEQRSSFTHSSIYKQGLTDTAGTGILSMGHSTSPRTRYAAIPSGANHSLFSFQAFTREPRKASIAVYSFTTCQLSHNVANIFIKDMSNGQRQLATHPSQRRYHHIHKRLDKRLVKMAPNAAD